jgi:two-component system, NarL family, nitrate/nitrite response regulator NarL
MLDRKESINFVVEQNVILTAREREIVPLIVRGLQNKDIATELQLSEGTVKIHLHNIFRKLSVKSRSALVARWHMMM